MILTVVTFIIVLGVLVLVHEAGHYFAARWTGVKVEEFSIGFPPRMVSKKVGDTNFMISWIPLGGYVKLFGQNFEDEDSKDPQNYASKSILQRFFILVAGPLMNIIFAWLIISFAYSLGTSSPEYLFQTPVIDEVQKNSYAERIGLLKNDRIYTVNGKEVNSWKEVNEELTEIHSKFIELVVLREGGKQKVVLNSDTYLANGFGWEPLIKPVVGDVSTGSPADGALQADDQILAINDQKIRSWSELTKMVSESAGKELNILVDRKSGIETVSVLPKYNEKYQKYILGVSVQTRIIEFGFLESFEKGLSRLLFITQESFRFLAKLLSGKGSSKDIGGPLMIAKIVGEAAQKSFTDVLFLAAFISLQLGIMNLLPIPALDGGHILFLCFEAIKGGQLSRAFRERVQTLGYSFLFVMMIYVTIQDGLRLF